MIQQPVDTAASQRHSSSEETESMAYRGLPAGHEQQPWTSDENKMKMGAAIASRMAALHPPPSSSGTSDMRATANDELAGNDEGEEDGRQDDANELPVHIHASTLTLTLPARPLPTAPNSTPAHSPAFEEQGSSDDDDVMLASLIPRRKRSSSRLSPIAAGLANGTVTISGPIPVYPPSSNDDVVELEHDRRPRRLESGNPAIMALAASKFSDDSIAEQVSNATPPATSSSTSSGKLRSIMSFAGGAPSRPSRDKRPPPPPPAAAVTTATTSNTLNGHRVASSICSTSSSYEVIHQPPSHPLSQPPPQRPARDSIVGDLPDGAALAMRSRGQGLDDTKRSSNTTSRSSRTSGLRLQAYSASPSPAGSPDSSQSVFPQRQSTQHQGHSRGFSQQSFAPNSVHTPSSLSSAMSSPFADAGHTFPPQGASQNRHSRQTSPSYFGDQSRGFSPMSGTTALTSTFNESPAICEPVHTPDFSKNHSLAFPESNDETPVKAGHFLGLPDEDDSPISPTTPASFNTSNYGLGLTSDEPVYPHQDSVDSEGYSPQSRMAALYPINPQILPPALTDSNALYPSHSSTGMERAYSEGMPSIPNSMAPSPTQALFAPSVQSVNSAPHPAASLQSSSQSQNDNQSRWPARRPYIRRNTVSSIHTASRKASERSLADRARADTALSRQQSIASSGRDRSVPPAPAQAGKETSPAMYTAHGAQSTESVVMRERIGRKRGDSQALSVSIPSAAAAHAMTLSPVHTQSLTEDSANTSSNTESMYNPESYHSTGASSHEVELDAPEAEFATRLEHQMNELLCAPKPQFRRETVVKPYAPQPQSPEPKREVSRAIEVVENGQGTVIKLNQGELVENLIVPAGTTHLLLSGSQQPTELQNMLKEVLPILASTLLVLDISYCQLEDLPLALTRCTHLEELNISGNPLMGNRLPSTMSFLRSLRVLMADDCGLSETLMDIQHLRKIHTLSLRHNRLRALPPWLCKLECLEELYVDGNPFFGEYASLVQLLLARKVGHEDAVVPVNPISPSGSETQAQTASAINSAAEPSLEPMSAAELPPPARVRSRTTTANSVMSDRQSFISRATSFRTRLRTASGANGALRRETSRIGSLLLADQDIPAQRSDSALARASKLKPMRSMGDLSAPQPSIQSLIQQSDLQYAQSEMDLVAVAAACGLDGGYPEPVPALPASRKHPRSRKTSRAPSVVEDSDMSDDEMPVPASMSKARKPSFFRKFKDKLSLSDRKKSSGNLRAALRDVFEEDSDDTKKPHALEGLPRPSATFLRDEMRSASDPTSTLLKKSISRTSLQTRRPKLSKLPAALKLDEPKKKKRRSYLTLNSVLPPVLSPGPLKLNFPSFSPTSAEDSLENEIERLQPLETLPEATTAEMVIQPVQAPPAPAMEYAPLETRKTVLKSLMRYLRDLDDLSEEMQLALAQRRQEEDCVSSPNPRIAAAPSISRKPSSVGVSSASSSRPDRSSGYESSRADTSQTSPSIGSSAIVVKDNAAKRERVINEIISSERSYTAGLNDLVQLYILPASAPHRSSTSTPSSRETVIPLAERRLVFSVADSIAQFHTKVFLPDLEAAGRCVVGDRTSASSLDDSVLRQAAYNVANAFLSQVSYLKLYHSYCSNADAALSRLAVWKSFAAAATTSHTPASPQGGSEENQNQLTLPTLTSGQKKRIKHLLKAARKDPRHTQMDLQSYLLMPIQRIPRYKLLLEALVECTPSLEDPSQPDPKLVAALEAVTQLAADLNERKREIEGRQRLLQWQGRLEPSADIQLVQPHRSLVKEGQICLSKVIRRRMHHLALEVATSNSDDLPAVYGLEIERLDRQLTYLLCSDILVLLRQSDPSVSTYSLVRIILLDRKTDRPQAPASLHGDGSTLRLVDASGIHYFEMDDARMIVELQTLINQQCRLQNYALF